MANESQFRIDVNLNGGQQQRPTSPKKSQKKSGFSISSMSKGLSIKNLGFMAAVGETAHLAKTYIDLQFGKAEKTMAVKRYNMLNPIHVAKEAFSVPQKAMQYNNMLEKRELRYNYSNEKYRQDVVGGSRWGAGR